MSEFSREDWIAAARAEIEGEGIHVAISDGMDTASPARAVVALGLAMTAMLAAV